MTDGVHSVIEDYTGYRPASCPWRAFFDPFVQRVIQAYRFFESGQLAWSRPRASHRLVDGIGLYHQLDSMIWSKQLRQEDEERKRSVRG